MRPVLVRIQPPQPSFPIANDQVVALRSSVYPWCTSHLTVVSPNSAKADARREGRKLPTIMLLTCPITGLSLTTPTVSTDFMSYFFCPRTHLPMARESRLSGYVVSLVSPQPARAVSASSLRCGPPNISSVTIDHDELCDLPAGRRVA